MIKYPLITILTPNWNTSKLLIDFLESVKNQTYPLDKIEIIIIDNGSTDDSIILIERWFTKNKSFNRTELIKLDKNYGIAKAYNKGLEISSQESEIIIRTESDIELEKGCIESLVRTLVDDTTIGLVGAKGVLYFDKKRIDHAARFMNWKTGTLRGLDPEELIECDCVFGGTFAVGRNLIERMGYFFKPDRFLANELEFCTRVKLENMKVVCQPYAISFHKVGNTTGKINKNKFSFIYLRESTLFHLEYNKALNKLTVVSLFFLAATKQLLFLNIYALFGCLSALFTHALKKNVLIPAGANKLDYEWLRK